MYVCICRGVTEKQIRQMAQQQPFSMQELSATTGVGTDCGTCTGHACQLLQDIGGNSPAPSCPNS